MGQTGEPKTDVRPAEDGRSEEARPEFVPLRRATKSERTSLFVIGPLLWLGALIVVAYTLRHGDSIEIAMVVLAAAVLFALAVLLPMRAHRVRQERKLR